MSGTDGIAEIGIDGQGRLFIKPVQADFSYVYRSAMEVHWDQDSLRLYSPAPREWTYAQWYQRILDAAADEYGISLFISDTTVWTDIPCDLRIEIEKKQNLDMIS